MKYIITLSILVSIALGINHHISYTLARETAAEEQYAKDMRQANNPVIGYFGNGCTKVYMGEADRIIEGLKYELRRDLYMCIKNKKEVN